MKKIEKEKRINGNEMEIKWNLNISPNLVTSVV